MIKRDRRGHSYCGVRGGILGSPQDEQLRKHLPRMFSLIKNESQRFEDDQIPPSSDHKRCQLAIRDRLLFDLSGSLRETKVFRFRGKYGCKAGT